MSDESDKHPLFVRPAKAMHEHTGSGGWNCRIVVTRDESGDAHYGIHEVFYQADGKPVGWACEPCRMQWESKLELLWYLEKVAEAAKRPVLDAMTMAEMKEDA